MQKMKQVQRLYSRKTCLEVSSQTYLFAIDKKLPHPPNKKFYYTRIVISAAVLVKSGKKAAYHSRVTSLGWSRQRVCTCRRVDCNSVIGMIMVRWLHPVWVDCWIGKVTTVARGK